MFSNRELVKQFIVIEGIDGAGTTTQSSLLANSLASNNFSVWKTAEPTDQPTGKLIRQILKGQVPATPETTAHLFAADRWEHTYGDNGIISTVKNGSWVVCDRYFFSSLSYQGLLADKELVYRLNENFPLPEYLFYLDIPDEVGSKRRSQRVALEIYEHDEFQVQVSREYNRILDYLSNTGCKVLKLSGDEKPEKLHTDIWNFLFPDVK